MFEIQVKAHFSAAHRLRGYRGKCEDLHGHNWQVEVFLRAATLDAIGMAIDFTKIKHILHGIIKILDHTYLNNLAYFKKLNPTSENIARYIFECLEKKRIGLAVAKVTVWESQTAAASFSRV